MEHLSKIDCSALFSFKRKENDDPSYTFYFDSYREITITDARNHLYYLIIGCIFIVLGRYLTFSN